MRDLFQVNADGVVEVLPQAWVLEPFKAIRDKYSANEIATLELGLVYFTADYRSDFVNASDDIRERVELIKKRLYSQRKLKIDDITYEAIRFYVNERDTTRIRLIRSVKKALNRAIGTIDKADIVDLKEIKDLAEIISKLPGMLENLEELEKFVKKEQQMDSGVAGSGEKGMYEDAD